MKEIHTPQALADLAQELGLRESWHEPDEQGIHAEVTGRKFDNAGFWGTGINVTGEREMTVKIFQDGVPVAEVNLATLCAWATKYGNIIRGQ